MATIDIIILLVLLCAGVYGAVKGLIGQIGLIAGLVLAIIVCRFWGGDVADIIVDADTTHAGVYRALVYAMVFVVVFFVVTFIAGLFGKALSKMHIRVIDRIGGALFSMGAAALIMSLFINVYLALAPSDRVFFSDTSKPWRSTVARMAPKVLGFITTP